MCTNLATRSTIAIKKKNVYHYKVAGNILKFSYLITHTKYAHIHTHMHAHTLHTHTHTSKHYGVRS